MQEPYGAVGRHFAAGKPGFSFDWVSSISRRWRFEASLNVCVGPIVLTDAGYKACTLKNYLKAGNGEKG